MNDSDEVHDILQTAEVQCYASTVPFDETWCELIFDGLMCWPPTPPGALANQSCSNRHIKSVQNGLATRQCNKNGLWSTVDDALTPWTNYTECGTLFVKKMLPNETLNFDIYQKWLPIIKSITQLGYVISTISLLIALFVFIHIKRLHCARNKLHIHLFISCLFRALMSLLKDGLFVKGTALAYDTIYINGEPQFMKDTTSWLCKAIISSRNYFIISNYVFVLMEGIYLHNLLFLKLFSENRVVFYYISGWTLPLIFIIPWIILKIKMENIYCWTLASSQYIDLLIQVPVGLSVTINFILFIIVIRVLCVKLTSMYTQQKRMKYKKLLKATMILLPLFGVPATISLILSFYALKDQTVEILWLFFDQAFIAFQGFFASLLYCLLNGEVQVEILRKYNALKDRNTRNFNKRTRTISHTTQMALTEELQELQHFSNLEKVNVSNKGSDYF